MRLLYIMNPTSGRTSNQDAIDYILQSENNPTIEEKIYFTTGEDDDSAIRQELKDFKPDRVAACGGDGTVQLLARNLGDAKIPMGIVPLGSANGLAKALDLPKDYLEAIELIRNSHQVIPLDLLYINGHLCTHLSDLGTNALLVKSFEESGDKGMIGYAKHLLSSIQQSDLMKCEIETSGTTITREGYMLVIANAHKYGTGVQISEGSVSDGKFEICNVQKIDIESAIKAGLTALNVFVDEDMFSDVITCTEARIRVMPRAHLQVDGEYIGEVDEVNVRIQSSALKVLVSR